MSGILYVALLVAIPAGVALAMRWLSDRGEAENPGGPDPMAPLSRGDDDRGPTFPLLPGDRPMRPGGPG